MSRSVMSVAASAARRPRPIAAITSSIDIVGEAINSGATRGSAYTTPSAARSTPHSNATRSIASGVDMTATVWANVSR